jgi:hypothetical protein
MDDQIPVTLEELQDDAQKALAVLDSVGKTPVPQTLRDAIEGNYFAASEGVVESALGHIPGDELREWRTRVIPLALANDILRDFENQIVRAFVLSSSSPFRILIDGIIKIPKWLIKHSAEIVFLFLPMMKGGLDRAADVLTIENRITGITREIGALRRRISKLFEITPVNLPPLEERKMRAPFGMNEKEDAAELVDAIKAAEREIGILEREREALAKLSAKAGRILDLVLVGLAVMMGYFVVEKLLAEAKALANAAATFAPVRKLRDEAVEFAKEASLPQFPQKRTVVEKRSRRN